MLTIRESAKHILHIVFIETKVELYQFWLSTFAVWWAIAIALTPSLFHVSSSYRIFRDLVTDPTWWIFLYAGLGTVGFYSLINKQKVVMATVALFLSILWMFTAAAFLFANGVVSTGVMIYGTLALNGLWNYIRIANKHYQPWPV